MQPREKNNAKVCGYTDSDFSVDQDEKKIMAWYIFMFENAPISWIYRNQSIIALPSCDTKYVDASYAACQTLWIKILLEDIKIMEPRKMKLFVVNKSSIDLENHHVCHGRSKHIQR